METQNVKTTVLPNGPLMVEGTISVTNVNNTTETKEGKVFFCRCGHSKGKPYCDGSHKAANFIG